MSKYIKKTIAEYKHDKKKTLQEHPTPAAPGMILSNLGEEEAADCVDQFCKYVSCVLYAVLKVLPDCANAIQDMTCHMTALGKEHWKVLERLLGYLKHHYRPMKFHAPKELRALPMFDGDWATDKNDQKSVSSYITTISGTSLVTWQSKKQQNSSLEQLRVRNHGINHLFTGCSIRNKSSPRASWRTVTEAKFRVRGQCCKSLSHTEQLC
jgi:hypothetical protein